MNLETALVLGFILHLIGDYLLQNDWMAQNKTSSANACAIHCICYSIPFAIILGDGWPLFIVFTTHYLIDRYRLAQYWIRLVNWRWDGDNFGFSEDKPKYMSVWLLIIIDNTFHVIFNSIAIWLAFK